VKRAARRARRVSSYADVIYGGSGDSSADLARVLRLGNTIRFDPSPAGGGVRTDAVAGPENTEEAVVEMLSGIAGGLVGSLISALKSARTGDQPPFAQILAEAQARAASRTGRVGRMHVLDPGEIQSVAADLLEMSMSLSSSEAYGIAAELVAMETRLRQDGGSPGFDARAERAIDRFLAKVSRVYGLTESQSNRLEEMARGYLEEKFTQRLPA